MAVVATEIKARFPEFACLDDDVVTRWLDEAARNINATQWDGKYDDGLSYLTAHLLVTFQADALGLDEPGAGATTSEKEGQISYAVSPLVVAPMFRKDSLGANKYGRRYLEIKSTIFVTRCF